MPYAACGRAGWVDPDMPNFVETDEQLLELLAGAEHFGISRVQRLTGLNFHKAAGRVERLSSKGLIRPVEGTPWKYLVVGILPSAGGDRC